MEVILLLLRLLLSGVFLIAGIGKLLDRQGSEKALAEFDVPSPLVSPLAAVLPWIELLVAFFLLFGSFAWPAAIVATVLLALFTAGMLLQIARGRAPDCHCFGQIHSEPVGVKSLIRNAALLAVAILILIAGSGSQAATFGSFLQYENGMQIAFGFAVVAFLVAIFVVLKKISDQQEKIIRRIEILEVISNEGREVERNEVSDPGAGIPIGSPIPEFDVVGNAGISIPSSDLVAGGRPSVIIFVSPNCHPCETLIPDISSWVEEFGERLEILLISSGSWQENLEKFGEQNADRLFLQQGNEASELMGPIWTPTAVVFDSNGRVASHNAVGDSSIRSAFELLKIEELEREFFFLSNGSGNDVLIGKSVPGFSLQDLDGNEVTEKDLLGKKTLAAFWSTTCPFCDQMLESIKEWSTARNDDDLNLILFSAGDPRVHRGLGISAPILLEDDYDTANKLGMRGTPSAILIDENGLFVSETGIGAENIWALAGETARLAKEKAG
ncbi:MAG: DoxX family membrane protein [Acidobacteria bacterium]|nr:MAG: DoxX family membrane protein [Acidobacteriota bacterium]REK01924.1 MAG: DoxX family membrane protein [Acidobacteriota bacterium]REK14880.1 MAG: DoxX family membrane protein [Acidobacteriota bacterium]REK45595.1 MAG: DoxX family membrane protein [Acidobacteriota bacterium]